MNWSTGISNATNSIEDHLSDNIDYDIIVAQPRDTTAALAATYWQQKLG